MHNAPDAQNPTGDEFGVGRLREAATETLGSGASEISDSQTTAVKGTSSVPPARQARPQDGSVLGQLEIPRLGLSVMVVEGTEDGDLNKAAGHIPGTALPGKSGSVGIAGHRDTFFRPLRHIRQSDTITLNTRNGAYRYRVVSTSVVRPEDTQVLYPTARDTMTLVTCFPFTYIGPAPKRFIVRAERTQE